MPDVLGGIIATGMTDRRGTKTHGLHLVCPSTILKKKNWLPKVAIIQSPAEIAVTNFLASFKTEALCIDRLLE